MKPKATLKELLKPPFSYDLVTYGIHDKSLEIVCKLTVAEKIGDVGRFTEQAMNEKWERDYGEPLRWWKRDGYWKCRCPKCLKDAMDFYDFCPSCGQRLLPPEGN
jgi:hypothetical protein